jgi:PAS domain S-box-containing protein
MDCDQDGSVCRGRRRCGAAASGSAPVTAPDPINAVSRAASRGVSRRAAAGLVLLAAGMGWLAPGAHTQDNVPTTAPHTGVLVLHSYHEGLTWTDGADRGIRAKLSDRQDIEVYTEYLDSKRIALDELPELFAAYLRRKYVDINIAAIIVSDNYALSFLTQHQADMFPDTPVVFCGVDDFAPEMLNGLDGPATGVVQALDPLGTLGLIRALQPDLGRLVIVAGSNPTAAAIRQHVQAELAKASRRPETVDLTGLTTAALVARLRQLQPADAVLLCNFNRDADGVYYSHEESARLISDASRAPVYAMQDLYLGEGVVGGSLLSSRDQGFLAAGLCLEILDEGRIPPIEWDCPSVLRCDYVAMSRFNLDPARLPETVRIVNRPVSFYERHTRLIWSTVGAFALLLVALAGVTFGLLRTRQAERKVRRSREDLRTTLNSIGDAVIATDMAGRVVRMNPVAERLTGWTAQVAVDRPLTEVFKIIDARSRQPIAAPVEEVLRTDKVVGLANHTVLIARDGTEYQIADSAAPIRAKGDAVTGVVLVFRDVTEEYRVRRQLAESEARMKLALQGAELGTWDWNVTSGHVAFDERWAAMLGCQRDELEPHLSTWEDRLHPEDRPHVDAALQAHLDGETAVYEAEYRMRHDAGHWIWVLDKGRVIERDAQGQPARMCGTHLDVSARKRAEDEHRELEAQLRQSQRLESIGLLAGGVAHDFNNILTAIFGNTELAMDELQSHLPGARGVLEGMHEIEKSVERAATLTRQLLAFGRRQVLHPQVLDLNTILRELSKMLRRLVPEQIALRLIYDPRLGAVRADPGQLEQVIVNLVVNARDAMPDGGELVVETGHVTLDEAGAAAIANADPGPYTVLRVTDTGIGMDDATRERVFEPFFTTKPVGAGTGLGLSTVYGIVQQAGGCISLESTPGSGTTFRIYIPIVVDAAAPRAPDESLQPPPGGTETILVCEDDTAVREFTAQVLKVAGYKVLVAADATEALSRADQHDRVLHLLVTDVVMPGMNGRDLADALTARRPDLQVLFVSGYASNVIADQGVIEHNVNFLEKPYRRSDLLRRIRAILDRARRTDATVQE